MKSCAICARLWRPPKIDMSALGIFDSVRIEADVTACEQCGSTSRVGRGLCLNCLLRRCLGSDSENKSTLKRLLDEIERRNYDVFTERVSLSTAEKAKLAAGLAWKRFLGFGS